MRFRRRADAALYPDGVHIAWHRRAIPDDELEELFRAYAALPAPSDADAAWMLELVDHISERIERERDTLALWERLCTLLSAPAAARRGCEVGEQREEGGCQRDQHRQGVARERRPRGELRVPLLGESR